MNLFAKLFNASENNFVIKLTFFGAGLGFSLILLSVSIDMYIRSIPASFSGFRQIYFSNVLHWIILTSPLFLGFIFYLLSRMIDNREKELSNRIASEAKASLTINKKINNLVQGNYSQETTDNESEVSKNLEILRTRLEQQQESDQRRKWATEGLAHFAEVLRQHNSLEGLSFDFLQSLVKYVKFNQGGVFLVGHKNDEQQTLLELKACYAYERKKFIEKNYEPGEGLVGQCFLEKRHILLYEVPKDYIQITSGLGQATPNCIVIFPLLTQESIEGVIELAGFRKLEQFEIEFLLKVCENFASVLKNAALAEKTSRLLEITKQQAETLKQKEEEMKQNLKDMEETMLEMLNSSSNKTS